MPRKRVEPPKHRDYAAPVPNDPEGRWYCLQCQDVFPNRGAVQLHQKTHKPHKHSWRLLRDRGDEARALSLGLTKICPSCGEVE